MGKTCSVAGNSRRPEKLPRGPMRAIHPDTQTPPLAAPQNEAETVKTPTEKTPDVEMKVTLLLNYQLF